MGYGATLLVETPERGTPPIFFDFPVTERNTRAMCEDTQPRAPPGQRVIRMMTSCRALIDLDIVSA
jgi:hypothetical protein